jgi:hypothetical protein
MRSFASSLKTYVTYWVTSSAEYAFSMACWVIGTWCPDTQYEERFLKECCLKTKVEVKAKDKSRGQRYIEGNTSRYKYMYSVYIRSFNTSTNFRNRELNRKMYIYVGLFKSKSANSRTRDFV